MAKTQPAWHEHTKLDIGELNHLNQQLFNTRYDTDQGITDTLREIIQDHYSYDIMDGTGPYLAVVLKVLSGPQVNNEASTNSGSQSKTTEHIEGDESPTIQSKRDAGKPPPIKVIARIPEFDRDIDWPEDAGDEARISAHGEYHEIIDNGTKNLEKIVPGSIILVQYSNKENTVSPTGRPVGYIIGLHEPGVFSKVSIVESPEDSFNKECKTSINRKNPAGNPYVGSTEENPNENSGPPIRKLKGKILTGMFGNGSEQTKQHFEECLKKSAVSKKHKIRGQAPDSNSAFIWVGHLRNNGHLDLLNRPIDMGRETIIYAPMMLDLSSPIEIKYYLHDQRGFGNAWLSGPNISPDTAVQDHAYTGNDFKEKVAPGIKDMIRDGRNFILVIPEMAHSSGYATGGAQRMFVSERDRAKVIERLETISGRQWGGDEGGENLVQITPFAKRELHTFDGSYSGGNFGLFHQEVVEVLDEHLGTIYDKINFVSILADGISGVTLASIVNKTPISAAHSKAESDFKDVPIKRIDYIDYGNINNLAYYNNFDQRTAAYTIYEDYLQEQASKPFYLEFNHISPPQSTNHHPFFAELGDDKLKSYAKNNGKVGGIGERKFSFVINNGTKENCLSMHQSSEDLVGYAFSMVNDFVPSFSGLPSKLNANTSKRPAHNSVPDHAYAALTRPSSAKVAKLQKEQEDLRSKIEYFESLLLFINGDVNKLCSADSNNMYKVYCNDGAPVTGQNSTFFRDYLSYLDDKKKFIKLGILAEYEFNLTRIKNNPRALQDTLSEVKTTLAEVSVGNDTAAYTTSNNTNADYLQEPSDKYTKAAIEAAGLTPEEAAAILSEDEPQSTQITSQFSIDDQWNDLRIKFDPVFFTNELDYIDSADIESGYLAIIAEQLAREEALEIYRSSLESAIKIAGPAPPASLPKCDPPPVRIQDIAPPGPPPAPSPPVVNPQGAPFSCDGKRLFTPSTYSELVTMIPYYPRKSDFSFPKRMSYSKTNLETKVEGGYEIGTFKYLSRGKNNSVREQVSLPVWKCLVPLIEQAWQQACQVSGYIPFSVTNAIRGSHGYRGPTAYRSGMSLHALGLAFDLDPQISGWSKGSKPINSVYTGAWTGKLLVQYGEELYNLGVFRYKPSRFMKNAFKGDTIRMAEDWKKAPDAYRTDRSKYSKIMKAATGSPIVPYDANPTLWMVIFCELSGMRFGNAQFLKKRYRGGKDWSGPEQALIAQIYGIPNIVQRVRALSWNSRVEDPMHFHFWGGKSLVPWSEIKEARKNRKK